MALLHHKGPDENNVGDDDGRDRKVVGVMMVLGIMSDADGAIPLLSAYDVVRGSPSSFRCSDFSRRHSHLGRRLIIVCDDGGGPRQICCV